MGAIRKIYKRFFAGTQKCCKATFFTSRCSSRANTAWPRAAVGDPLGLPRERAHRRTVRLRLGAMAAPAEILLITSKDEPRGIADDAYLKSALSPGLAAWRWCDWDDVPPTPPPTASFWIRSLWEGRDAQGATPRLRTFLASLAAAAPQLAADYELILWIVHKRYLLELGRGGTVPTVPTVLTSELVERAGARPEGGEGGGGAVAVSPGAIKRAMVSRGWADAVLKPAVGTRCEGVLRLSTRGDEWTLGQSGTTSTTSTTPPQRHLTAI